MLDTRTEPKRHNTPKPPPKGPARAAGGLLGVIAGATFASTAAGQAPRSDNGDQTSTAIVELSRAYAGHPAGGSPLAVAARQAAAPAPAWMLPVAITHTKTANLVGDTVKLAAQAGVSGGGLAACITYTKIATYLLAAYPTDAAIELGTGAAAAAEDAVPELTGQPPLDAVRVATWTLLQPGGIADVLPMVAAGGQEYAAAAAAAAGLVGLRDGLDGIPLNWHHQLATTDQCLTLAYGLLRASSVPFS